LGDATLVVNPAATIETFVIVSVELTHGSLTLVGRTRRKVRKEAIANRYNRLANQNQI
jgi:hypothetical protein